MALARASRTSRRVLSSASAGGASSGNQRRSGDSSLGRAMATARRDRQPAHVEVAVGTALRALERVDVDVDRSRQEHQSVDPALLDRLPPAVAARSTSPGSQCPPSWSQRPIFGMEREQGAAAGRRRRRACCRSGDRRAAPPHGVLVGGEVLEDLAAQPVLGGVRARPSPRGARRRGVEGVGGHGGTAGAAYERGTVRRVAQHTQADVDPARFVTRFASPRGFRQAYVHEGMGGVPLVCVHGWPETKRIFWRVIEPLGGRRLRGDRPGPAGLRRERVRAGRLPRRARARPRPPRAGARPPRPRRGGAGRRRPRRPRGPGPRAAAPGLGRRGWCCSTRRCPTTRSGWPGCGPDRRPRRRLLHPPGNRCRRTGRGAGDAGGAPAVHRHLLHEPLLGSSRCLRRCGRLPHRAVRVGGVAAGQLRRVRERLRSHGAQRAVAARRATSGRRR